MMVVVQICTVRRTEYAEGIAGWILLSWILRAAEVLH
jgi:hypothetical protein